MMIPALSYSSTSPSLETALAPSLMGGSLALTLLVGMAVVWIPAAALFAVALNRRGWSALKRGVQIALGAAIAIVVIAALFNWQTPTPGSFGGEAAGNVATIMLSAMLGTIVAGVIVALSALLATGQGQASASVAEPVARPAPVAVPPAPAAPPASASDPADAILKLKGLYDAGAISDEEFQQKRREMLDRL